MIGQDKEQNTRELGKNRTNNPRARKTLQEFKKIYENQKNTLQIIDLQLQNINSKLEKSVSTQTSKTSDQHTHTDNNQILQIQIFHLKSILRQLNPQQQPLKDQNPFPYLDQNKGLKQQIVKLYVQRQRWMKSSGQLGQQNQKLRLKNQQLCEQVEYLKQKIQNMQDIDFFMDLIRKDEELQKTNFFLNKRQKYLENQLIKKNMSFQRFGKIQSGLSKQIAQNLQRRIKQRTSQSKLDFQIQLNFIQSKIHQISKQIKQNKASQCVLKNQNIDKLNKLIQNQSQMSLHLPNLTQIRIKNIYQGKLIRETKKTNQTKGQLNKNKYSKLLHPLLNKLQQNLPSSQFLGVIQPQLIFLNKYLIGIHNLEQQDLIVKEYLQRAKDIFQQRDDQLKNLSLEEFNQLSIDLLNDIQDHINFHQKASLDKKITVNQKAIEKQIENYFQRIERGQSITRKENQVNKIEEFQICKDQEAKLCKKKSLILTRKRI